MAPTHDSPDLDLCYAVSLESVDETAQTDAKRVLDAVARYIKGHADGSIIRVRPDTWTVGYLQGGSTGMPSLLAIGELLANSKVIKRAGLQVFWKDPCGTKAPL